MVWENVDWLSNVPDVPELSQAVITTAWQVVLTIGIEV